MPLEDRESSASVSLGMFYGVNRCDIVRANFFRRGFDQIRSDLESPRHLEQYKETKDAEDLPGLGRHYCVSCAKWFESEYNMKAHTKGKNHKRRCVWPQTNQPSLAASLTCST